MFVLILFIMAEKIQTIVLTAPFADEDETIEDKDHKIRKRSYCVSIMASTEGKKQAITKVF